MVVRLIWWRKTKNCQLLELCLKKVPIILLDEATSSLGLLKQKKNSKSYKFINKRIEQLVVIAHRLINNT